MIRRLSLLCLFFLCATVPAIAQTFVFHLSGDQEVPPVPTTASGGCMGTLNQGARQFTFTCVHNIPSATMMHIHRGAPGAVGDIVFQPPSITSPVNATWSAMTDTNISELLAGNLYLNIHTAGRPGGEIRGQILPRTIDTVSFTADGSQNVPPNATAATASCTADLDNSATQLAIQCTHDVPSPQSAHVHEGEAGTNGPIAFTFPSPTSPLSANMPMTPLLVAEFEATFLYLDIHGPNVSEETAGPTIRGQIGTPPSAATTGTIRITKRTTPGGGTNFGFTENVSVAASFTLNDTQTKTFTAVAPGTYTITENDPSSSPGGYALADISCGDDDSTGDVATRSVTIHVAAAETVDCTFRNMAVSPTDQLFVFHMSGDQEVPPVATNERGGCMGRFDAGTSRFTLLCTHDVVNPAVMHVHRGAVGATGDIVFNLDPASPVLASVILAPADVANLLAGNLYVNIHTAGRPGGAIRGQIVPRSIDTIAFALNGSQVVPPDSTTATGSCTADLDTNATALAINCTHNLPSPDAAHVHDAPFGFNGPIVYTFPSASSPIASNAPMTPRLVADFEAYFLYLDVHGPNASEETAGGSIRGQIGVPPAVVTTGTIRIEKRTSPAGGSSFGFTDNVPASGGTFTLADGGAHTFTNVPAGTYTITENDPAASGYTLTDIACGDNDSSGNPFARAATVNLQAGETVVCTFTNLRTVVPTSLFVFHLSADQEVPPHTGTERGGCMGQFDLGSSTLSLVCTHNVVDPTVMHIHHGARGVNGTVAFDLGNPVSPVEAVWSGISPADVAELMSGNLYVNIHTSGRPGGAIRGQIVPRSVDSLTFPLSAAQEVPPTDSAHTGSCGADLNDSATSLFVQCTHNVPDVTDIHLHDAPPGQDGPVIWAYPHTSPFTGNTPLTPRYVADFAAGFLYVNVHSVNYDTGEIRGQVLGPAGAFFAGAAIPTLSEWMLIALGVMLAALAAMRLK